VCGGAWRRSAGRRLSDVVGFGEVVPGEDLDDIGAGERDGGFEGLGEEVVGVLDSGVGRVAIVEAFEMSGGYGWKGEVDTGWEMEVYG